MMHRRAIPRNDPRYKQIRAQNNSSVKKSRDKSRRERDETMEAISQLEKENQQLSDNVQIVKQEYEALQRLFKQHTGIDIEQMVTSEPKPESTPELPVPSVEPQESVSKPLLVITAAEEQPSATKELDANNLDGSIVVIHGVQYKIVSINKT